MLPLEGLITVVGLWTQANDNVAVEIERPHDEDPDPELVVYLHVQRRGRLGINLDSGVAHFFGQSIVIDGLEQQMVKVSGPQNVIALLSHLRDSLI